MSGSSPRVGLILIRGLGYGALAGAVGGFLLMPLVQLLSWSSARDVAIGLLLGSLVAPIGVLYGLIAGLVVAAAYSPIRWSRHPAGTARVVAAIVGPLAVAVVSRVVFDPSMRVGANEGRSHVVERLLLFYAVPCGFALVAGAAFGARLAAPSSTSSTGDSGARRG